MSCGFSLDHYRELLNAATVGGYRWALFDFDGPKPGDLMLRHDVDLSLEAAVQMAELEAESGVRASYFLMTESVFYNLDSHVGVHAIERLKQLGHFVGLHAVHHGDPWPRAGAGYEIDSGLDERFSGPVIAWHNPEPEYMSETWEGLMNVMEPQWFDPEHYRSDSNAHWRRGCPHEQLERGEFEWLQLLTHPEIWVYDGATMGETMRSFLDADRAARLEHLRADRIDLS